MEISSSVLAMSSQDMRLYDFQYIDVEDVLEKLFARSGGMCTDCAFKDYQDDCNAWECPAGFDYLDCSCEKWYVVNHYLPYFIMADMLLREEFGDVNTHGK